MVMSKVGTGNSCLSLVHLRIYIFESECNLRACVEKRRVGIGTVNEFVCNGTLDTQGNTAGTC